MQKETPNPSRMRGRGVEVSKTLFYASGIYCNCNLHRVQEIEIIYNHIEVFDHSKFTLWKEKAV